MSSDSATEADFVRELTKHQTVIVVFIRSLLPVQGDVDDLLQEVNVTMWEKRSKWQKGTNFKAWAFQIAKYHALNERRKIQRHTHLVFDDAVFNQIAEADGIDEEAVGRRYKALEACLATLSVKNKQLIRARYFKGETIEKYAEYHKCHAGALRTTLTRLRIKLKDCINFQLTRKER